MSYYLPVASKENLGVKYLKIIAHSKEVIKTPNCVYFEICLDSIQ